MKIFYINVYKGSLSAAYTSMEKAQEHARLNCTTRVIAVNPDTGKIVDITECVKEVL
jgi:hypothetical protein